MAYLGFCGWLCGAIYFYAAYLEGSPFDLLPYLFGSTITAAVGSGIAACFSRNPATRYLPKPSIITIENADNPEMEIPQRNRSGLRVAGACLVALVIGFSGMLGREDGAMQFKNIQEIESNQQAKVSVDRDSQNAIVAGNFPVAQDTAFQPQNTEQSKASFETLIQDKKFVRNHLIERLIPTKEIEEMEVLKLQYIMLVVLALR